MIMTLNDVLTRQNVITKVLLKDGDKELPKELKVKIMRIRMAYAKIKKNFDSEVQEFINELMSSELSELSQKVSRTDEENTRLEQLNSEINTTYQEFLIQKGNEEVTTIKDDFITLDEYSDIVEVNAGNNVTINGNIVNDTDFLEIIYDLFVKEN